MRPNVSSVFSSVAPDVDASLRPGRNFACEEHEQPEAEYCTFHKRVLSARNWAGCGGDLLKRLCSEITRRCGRLAKIRKLAICQVLSISRDG